jgi:hypothetical protein
MFNMKKIKHKRVNMHLSTRQIAELEKRAIALDCSVASLVRQAIDAFLRPKRKPILD